ncbi:ankyrin repeat protein [Penicillium malachiteum]|uniref:ankyrin repeat protein n=1 Tax=Penicillium malachiteum TaxID=1324776 RepID=UPI0025492F31|nr:ankyrin repeat protein [Penicillium malachiteum]KAJ5729784.1 ankyrin repeat protein [Penicillium malachiteum]
MGVCPEGRDDFLSTQVPLLNEEHKRPLRQSNDDSKSIDGRMEQYHNAMIAFPGAGSYGLDVISQTAAHMNANV